MVIFALGFFCLWLYPGGAFDEFDFWTGTFALVVFALGEAFIFSWVFGIEKGWAELNRGADIKIPYVFRYVIKYVTPAFILVIFIGAMIKPDAGDWGAALSSLFSGEGWSLAPDSVIGKILHVGVEDYKWFDAGKPTRAMIEDVTRILLSVVFATCGLLIWKAWRMKEEKQS
jgi:hypothetical protein